MEPFNAGWLSIVPPIVAIALALITKEVLSSLVLGILTGTLIYTIGMDGNVLMGTLESAFTVMGNKVDFNILIFCSLLGALVYVVAMSGGTKAYGNWAVKRIKGRKSALAATTGLGALIFIDDYFNCLTVGTVMRPICDRYNIARAKLAYIIDSTAAPVCIIAPVSSWAAAVGSSLQGSTAFDVHRHDSLELLRAALPAAHRLHRRDRLRLRPDAQERGARRQGGTVHVDRRYVLRRAAQRQSARHALGHARAHRLPDRLLRARADVLGRLLGR